MLRMFFRVVIVVIVVSVGGCSGCSKSGQRELAHPAVKESPATRPHEGSTPGHEGSPKSPEGSTPVHESAPPTHTGNGPAVVHMEEENGVYKIPVTIDDVPMFFIFDTGASTISISETEAAFLFKQGKLTDEDVGSKEKFIDAEGNVNDGTIIRLRTVSIGGMTLQNVQASVVHNLNAPLLFGQSALQKFGRVTIDYTKKTIAFE
jgi:aspartyl protease family protein